MAKVLEFTKKWVKVLWEVPAVKSAIGTLVVRLIVFIGLPAGVGLVVSPVLDAIVGNL